MAASFVTTIASLVLMVVLMLLFCYLRKRYKTFYMPKSFSSEAWAPQDRRGWFGWITFTLFFPEERLLASSGIDAVLYLRSLKFCVILLTILSILGCCILIPINRIGGEHKIIDQIQLFDSLSVANIKEKSSLLWVHLIAVFGFSFITYYFIKRLYRSLISVEVSNSQYKHDSIMNRTVLVTNIPNIYASDEELKACFVAMFGDKKVVHTIMVPLVESMHILHRMRESTFRKLKRATDIMSESQMQKRPKHKKGFLGLFGAEVDSIEFYENELDIIDQEMNRMKEQKFETTNTGFVTFDSVATAMQCAQTLLHHNRNKLKPSLAPYPTDINWEYFSKSSSELKIRSVLVYALMIVLFLFWSIPISAIAASANLDNLAKFDALKWLVRLAEKDELIKNAIQGFLPSIALSIFLVLLPFILKLILVVYKHMLNSQYDRALMRSMWLFLTMNVFLVTIVTGTFLNISNSFHLVDQTKKFIDMLAISLPAQALRFANYIAFEGFVGYPAFFFCRFDDLLICKIKQIFFAKTRREMFEAEIPTPFDYPVQYAREFFIFTIAMTYASMSPIVVPLAALYFALAYLSAKHNFIYVFYPPYKGRKVTQIVVDRIIFALLLYQLSMLGMFTLKLFQPGGVVAFLAIYTGVFRWYMKKTYFRSSQYLALRDCPKASQVDTAAILQEIQETYMHPALMSHSSLPAIAVVLNDEDSHNHSPLMNNYPPVHSSASPNLQREYHDPEADERLSVQLDVMDAPLLKLN